MLSFLPSIFVLGLAAIAAVLLVQNRPSPPEYESLRFATWFLAIAGMFNAIAHPLLCKS